MSIPHRAAQLSAAACACVALGTGLAACGGGNDAGTATVKLTELANNQENGSSPGSPATGGLATGDGSATPVPKTPAAGAQQQPSGAGAQHAEGKAIFMQTCASCHTLADAGATGSVGPNLDQLKLDQARIAAQIRTGGGGMPSFGGTLAPKQIAAIAAYVAAAAGS
jgi:mono/diheme cytochrome c family protein